MKDLITYIFAFLGVALITTVIGVFLRLVFEYIGLSDWMNGSFCGMIILALIFIAGETIIK